MPFLWQVTCNIVFLLLGSMLVGFLIQISFEKKTELFKGVPCFKNPEAQCSAKFSSSYLLKKAHGVINFLLRVCVLSYSLTSDSLPPHGLYPARLLCPWDFPGKNARVGCHFTSRGSSWSENRTCVSFIGRLPMYHLGIPFFKSNWWKKVMRNFLEKMTLVSNWLRIDVIIHLYQVTFCQCW